MAILSADLPESMEFPVSSIYQSKIISGDEVFSVGYPTTAGTSTSLYDYIKSTGNDSSLDGNYNLLVGFLKPQIFRLSKNSLCFLIFKFFSNPKV